MSRTRSPARPVPWTGAVSDRVRLVGIRGVGYHGVFEEERRDGQMFVVDVELTAELSTAGASDDLADTVDYGAIAAAVLTRIEGEPHQLIERVADLIAGDVLTHPRVDAVTVTVHKPQAPVDVPFGDIAVEVTRTRPLVPVVIAVGANLPYGAREPADTVAAAVAGLDGVVGVPGIRVSGRYESAPVGGPEQPRYVNAVALGRTSRSPWSLLMALLELEDRWGRTRATRWGPRTLDLDLVQYGDPVVGSDVVVQSPRLTLPHPRAHERGFVLVPWLDADPDAVLRHHGEMVPVARLAEDVDATELRLLPDAGPSNGGPGGA